MTVFAYSQVRQKLASLLDIARRGGEVQIRRKDGSMSSISPLSASKKSPLDVRGLKTKATTSDILSVIRESRTRS